VIERLQKLKDDESGHVLIEFAILLPLLITLVFGYIFFMNGVEKQIVMQTAAREGARTYANPIEGTSSSNRAEQTVNEVLHRNGLNSSEADVSVYASGKDRIVEIEMPYSVYFPMKNFTLKAGAIFHVEPFDR